MKDGIFKLLAFRWKNILKDNMERCIYSAVGNIFNDVRVSEVRE